jgi:L-ascorbate metabolism protein UlaG (beta-lactamase superfamily)
MKVRKLGHCCFVAEPKKGLKIMTDPGAFSTLQNKQLNIDVILITHEHSDHLHVESLKEVIENNKGVIVITNTAVGKILEKEGIPHTKVEDGGTYEIQGVVIKGFGSIHEEIYGDYGRVQNTGYMIDTLFYPGDAFYNPNTPVDILAIPLAGPWVMMKNVIEYAKKIKPRILFPVHDGFIQDFSPHWRIAEYFVKDAGIQFKKLEIGKDEEL